MAVGSLGNALIEIGGTQLRHLVYGTPLQDKMLLGIDFMQEHGVQLHCSTGEFPVGANLTIQPMFKANSPSMQAVLVRRVNCQWG